MKCRLSKNSRLQLIVPHQVLVGVVGGVGSGIYVYLHLSKFHFASGPLGGSKPFEEVFNICIYSYFPTSQMI